MVSTRTPARLTRSDCSVRSRMPGRPVVTVTAGVPRVVASIAPLDRLDPSAQVADVVEGRPAVVRHRPPGHLGLARGRPRKQSVARRQERPVGREALARLDAVEDLPVVPPVRRRGIVHPKDAHDLGGHDESRCDLALEMLEVAHPKAERLGYAVRDRDGDGSVRRSPRPPARCRPPTLRVDSMPSAKPRTARSLHGRIWSGRARRTNRTARRARSTPGRTRTRRRAPPSPSHQDRVKPSAA